MGLHIMTADGWKEVVDTRTPRLKTTHQTYDEAFGARDAAEDAELESSGAFGPKYSERFKTAMRTHRAAYRQKHIEAGTLFRPY